MMDQKFSQKREKNLRKKFHSDKFIGFSNRYDVDYFPSIMNDWNMANNRE